MGPHNLDFNRRAVSPWTCLIDGWSLIKADYWLYLAIAFVGVFIAQIAPFALLVGPAMCGIHLCFLRRERDLPVRFEMLFDGFNYFLQSLIATLILVVPEVILGVLIYLLTYVIVFGFFFAVAGAQPQNPGAPPMNLPDPEIGVAMCAGGSVMMLICVSLALFMHGLFLFTYPLIVDRELTGWDALKLSCRAVWANLGGILGLVFLQFLLTLASMLLCCVGPFFIMPLELAMVAIAYRQVFPADNPLDDLPPELPPDDDARARGTPPSEGITASADLKRIK